MIKVRIVIDSGRINGATVNEENMAGGGEASEVLVTFFFFT